MKVVVVYDDTGKKSEVIEDIIGDKGFADVVVKKKRLEEYYEELIKKVYIDVDWRCIKSQYEYADLTKELEMYDQPDIKVLHTWSNYVIADKEKALLSFEKLKYIDEPYRAMDKTRVVAAMFPNIQLYIKFLRSVISGQKSWDAAKNINSFFEIEGVIDIGVISNFIQCVTGNFESRYFNSLKGNEYTIVKTSKNKNKIKSEYCYYHFLPEDMQFWFVMPFNYKEDEASASYTMERLHMTDLAIKWVHGSMDESEFRELMDKFFYFFRSRHERECTKEEYEKVSKSLYVEKVNNRIEDLKKTKEYKSIEKLLEVSDNFNIDSLKNLYFDLKKKIEMRNHYPWLRVIGHGDPCFANSMYNKSTKTLKFVDPKGALKEEDLWTNPYYDIAKLSHSICGRYDFFNNALFDIRIDENFSYELSIPFDNSRFIEIFRKKVEENGFDFLTVRIYEASLFLSMLPLHIDNPYKVFGFILNVKNILEEIKNDV